MGNVSAPSCASRTCVGHPQHRGHPRLSDPQQLEGKSPRAPKGDFTSLCFMGHRGTTEPFVSWGRGRSPAVRPWGHPPLCPARPGPRSPARTLTRTWPSLSCVTITAESLSFSSKWTWPGFPSLGWLGAKRTAPAFALLPAWGWENSSSSSTPISHPHTPMGMNGTEDPNIGVRGGPVPHTELMGGLTGGKGTPTRGLRGGSKQKRPQTQSPQKGGRTP